MLLAVKILVLYNPNLKKLVFSGFSYQIFSVYDGINNKCLQHVATYCHNLEEFSFTCNHDDAFNEDEFTMDENIASYRLECLTNICRSNKNLKSYKISGFAYRDPKFFNLGTYCPLLESLTLINNYRAFSSHPTEEEIEDFTKGCRNLKYLHIESWIAGDIMEDILQ